MNRIRRIVSGLNIACLDEAIAAFPKRKVDDALFKYALCTHIIAAEQSGAPIKTEDLAKRVLTPVPTIRRHIQYLRKQQRVILTPEGLRMNSAAMSAPEPVADAVSAAERVIAAGEELKPLVAIMKGRPPMIQK